MNKEIEVIDGVRGEWRTVTKPEEVTVGQRVRFKGKHRSFGYIELQSIKKIKNSEFTIIENNNLERDIELFDSGYWTNIQAFFPLPVKIKRKVAKVSITQAYASSLFQICGLLNGIKFYNHYKSRKSAIRGARRFCAAIGYECEIVK